MTRLIVDVGVFIDLSTHHKSHDDKEKNKGNKHQEPRDSFVTIFAYQVQNPCPEEDIDELDDEDKGGTGNTGGKGA